jgi:hypothetical protein
MGSHRVTVQIFAPSANLKFFDSRTLLGRSRSLEAALPIAQFVAFSSRSIYVGSCSEGPGRSNGQCYSKRIFWILLNKRLVLITWLLAIPQISKLQSSTSFPTSSRIHYLHSASLAMAPCHTLHEISRVRCIDSCDDVTIGRAREIEVRVL